MQEQFPFVVDGIRGDVPINMYPTSDSEKGVVMEPCPGLSTFCTLQDCSEVRGLYAWGEYLYAVARRGMHSVFFEITQNGTYTERGIINTSAAGPVWIVNNPTQLCIVDGVWGYVYTFGTGMLAAITDLDFPGASSCSYQDGYGLFTEPNSNRWFFSSLFDFTSFDSLDFYGKQSSPDNVVSILSYMREPRVFGGFSTEQWYNAGGDNSSITTPTFAINTGGLVEYGCGAAKSPSTVDGEGVLWLSDKGQLVTSVQHTTKVVNNQMFSRAVKGMGYFSDAIAFSYRDKNHVFYQITFSAAGQTWVYDATTQTMFKKTSFVNDSPEFGRHRANCYAMLKNKHYVGDYNNGRIYIMSGMYYDDAGEEIQRVLHTREVDGGLQRLSFPSVQLVVNPGVGLESGLDPQVMMQFSIDGGMTWTGEQWRSAGKIGDYMRQAVWHRQGSGFRRMYKFVMTDPVLWQVLGVSYWKE